MTHVYRLLKALVTVCLSVTLLCASSSEKEDYRKVLSESSGDISIMTRQAKKFGMRVASLENALNKADDIETVDSLDSAIKTLPVPGYDGDVWSSGTNYDWVFVEPVFVEDHRYQHLLWLKYNDSKDLVAFMRATYDIVTDDVVDYHGGVLSKQSSITIEGVLPDD